ncbi:diacylglycerol/lipid kinase family protein [Rufibacter roseus]|uniref:Diacylglycerol/lipid kinase family protein n=1 Tax=Rufibacter roseus TaxID=1567108 RepID=A0ABW2DPV6_9BACT|nr:diacylglycerol kinase family protein [Rufibacter roseus]
MAKILFAINPIAGDIDKEELEQDMFIFCQRQKVESIFFKTTGQKDEERLREHIDSFQPDIVVAVGGDGTVNMVAKLLINTAMALAIIPQGSGNGLSKDLDIPQDFIEALEVINHYKIKSIDTLLVNEEPSIHLCDLGFNALVVKQFNEGDTRGPGAYAWIALQQFMAYEPKKYTVLIEGKEVFSGEAFMVTVTNAKAFGSNAAINPNGVINDGLFEIFILKPFPKTASLGILYQMYTENIDESEFTQKFSCQEATIINHCREVCHIDGEPVPCSEVIHFKVLPSSLKVVLPAE